MRASSMEMPVQIRGVLEPPEYHDFRLYFGKGAVVRGSASREYAVLKNSLIVQQPSGDHDERIIKISCDAKEAQNLLALAADVFPDAVPPIEKALASLGTITEHPSGPFVSLRKDFSVVKFRQNLSFVRYNYDSQIMPCTM